VSDPKSVTWLRLEYKGREDELISLAAGAALVGVSRSAVSNWAKRHANFPKIALLTGLGDRRMKYVPRSEFLDFARAQMNKKRGGPSGPAAPLRPPPDHHRRSVSLRRPFPDHRVGTWWEHEDKEGAGKIVKAPALAPPHHAADLRKPGSIGQERERSSNV
jgi:hypothetical protein